MKQLNIKASDHLCDKFEQLCAEKEITQAEMLSTLIDYYNSPFTGSMELELQKARFNLMNLDKKKGE